MDDPWANAWGEPSKHSPTPPSPAWVSSSSAQQEHLEADIAIPSWETGPAVKWDEPSDAHASLWKRDEIPLEGWEPVTSPYQNIPIGKPSLSFSDPIPSSSSSAGEVDSVRSKSRSPPVRQDSPRLQTLPDEQAQLESASFSPQGSSESPPSSPDAFGTFETALDFNEADIDPWPPSAVSYAPNSADAAEWGTAWSAPNSAATEVEQKKSGLVDEWEYAKQQKEKQDQHVPPELLKSILQQFEELSNKLWPTIEMEGNVSVHSQSESASKRDYSSKELGLDEIIHRLVPDDLTLPSNTPFSKSFTVKRTAEALRLTRNTPISHMSPMSVYMTSKGSTSWEAALKSKPEVGQVDVAPVGWRVVQRDEDISPVDDGKKKSGAGLLSFFSRKGTNTPDTSNTQRSASQSRPSSTPPVARIPTPSSSVDTTAPPSDQTIAGVSSSTGHSRSGSISTSANPSSTSASITTFSQIDVPRTDTPPPSAVSRFLGRFSRTKSSNSSGHNSLALSSDDLEFLSDIVPSATDVEHHDASLDNLTSMIQSSPLSTKLPPALAPPPKASPHLSVQHSRSGSAQLVEHQSGKNGDSFAFDMTSVDSPISQFPDFTIPTATSIPRPMSPIISSPVIPPQLETRTQRGASGSEASWPDFDDFLPSVSRVQTPALRKETPPLQPKRAFAAIMSNSTVSLPPPSIPTLNAPPRSPSPFVIPAPSRHNSLISSTKISSLPPPPSSVLSSTPTSSRQPPQVQQNKDDDFSDFFSSPSQAATPGDLSFSSAFSDQNLLSFSDAGNKDRSSDSLDSFGSFPLRSPSPPPPPEKPPSFNPSPTLHVKKKSETAASPPKISVVPPRKVSRASDHQRTMSLLETAAARGNRKWPAPPSPLPEAIPPPNAKSGDLFGSSMQAQQANAITNLQDTSSISSNVLPETSQPWKLPPLLQATVLRSNASVLEASSRAGSASGSNKTGGLSAQDLSFFEGL